MSSEVFDFPIVEKDSVVVKHMGERVKAVNRGGQTSTMKDGIHQADKLISMSNYRKFSCTALGIESHGFWLCIIHFI